MESLISPEKLKELSKQWVLTMIYGESYIRIENLIESGCRVMVYGHQSYDDIENIIKELIDSEKIIMDNDRRLKLTARGIFEVQKQTILPLLELTSNKKYLEAFVIANKEKCNIEFLESLASDETKEKKVSKIKEFTKQNYLDIVKITTSIISFLNGHPNFQNMPSLD